MKQFFIACLIVLLCAVNIYAQESYEYLYNPMLAMSDDGVFVAVTGRAIEDSASSTGQKYMIDVYDTATGERILEYDGSEFPVKFLSLNADGTLLGFANNGGILWIVSTATTEIIERLANGYRDVGYPQWSSEAEFFAYASGSSIPIYNASSFQIYGLAMDVDSMATVVGFAWHPSTARLVTSMYDANSGEWSMLVWSVLSEQNLTLDQTLDIRGGSQLDWHPNNELIVTNQRGGIKIIDIRSDAEAFLAIPDTEQPIYSVDWSPDGTKIAAGGNQVYVWDTETGSIIETILTEDRVETLFWSPDNQHIYHTGGSAGIYRDGVPLWEALAAAAKSD
jgi:WD40 repeat protein